MKQKKIMIYVLKTSVPTKRAIKRLQPHLDKMLKNSKWNFDLSDDDKILRIDTNENCVLPVIELLKAYQFTGEELD